MLTSEIVLKVFSDYLNRDADFEVILTSRGYTVMGFDNHRQDWNTVDFCPTPEALRDSLLNAYESFRKLEITGGDRDLTEKEEAQIIEEQNALTALCEKEAVKMFILKILFAPLSLILSLFVWLCAGLGKLQDVNTAMKNFIHS